MSPAASACAGPSFADLYRALWRHAEGARPRFVLAMAMLATSQLVKLAMPWMAAQAINRIQAAGVAGLPAAGWWIAGLLATYCGVWSLHGPARVIERSVGVRVRRSVADLLYARLAAAPLPWHEQRHSGELQHRVAQASGALYSFTQNQFIYLQAAVNLVGPLLALWWLSPATGGVALVGYAVIFAVIVRFDGSLMRLAAQENTAERRYAARLLDFVGNIGSVKSLRLQGASRRLLDRRLGEVFQPLARSIVLTEWKWCGVDLMGAALTWGLVVVYVLAATGGAAPAAAGTLLLGSLFMVHQYAQQAAGVVGALASHYQAFARARTDYAQAAEILQAPQAAPVAPADGGWRRIDLHDLAYDHAGGGGVEGVRLSLHRGERLALVGPSGSGKSTLLKLLAGLYEAGSGHIEVDGVALAGRRHLADRATLVPQEAEVFEASVRENIVLDPQAGDGEAPLAAALHASSFDGVLSTLPQGLDTPLAERGMNLSGGQRQRLALARGLFAARHSSLLLLDEPTSALDPITELRVHHRIDAAFADATVVASVHRMSLLGHFDRVALMVGGRLVDVGTVDQLRERQPLFARLLLGAAADDVATPAPASRGPADERPAAVAVAA
ncbi:ABC transporter ATP-binding protein [Aquabacterium sp. J223]|uniref:ABC transporter ATP-binding protein n=1 Tax=Aquabacterium sp. J223 TaxID=2898431 RepID=UPI0021ADFED1|nr:ABC transporter ATP-binding protein [Aquabacterium sp. J223]UUX94275.1 ABC transporter ATP-binding protein/permease [Aquabacterium sp. J223]